MPNRMDQFRAQMFDAIGEMNKAIAERKKKRERDAIAAELAAQYPDRFTGIDSADELEMSMKLHDWDAQRKYREALTKKAERVPLGRGGASGSAGLREAPSEGPKIQNGFVWNGRMWVKAPKGVSADGSTVDPDRAALDKDLRTKFGIDWRDMEDIMARGATPDEKDPNALSFKTKAGVDLQLDRQKLMPYVNRGLKIYESQAGGHVEPNASALTAQTQPRVAAPRTDSLTIPPDKGAEADAIRAAFKRGEITREEARAKLSALSSR